MVDDKFKPRMGAPQMGNSAHFARPLCTPTLCAHFAILSSLRGKGDYWLEGLYLTIWRTGSCFPRVKLVRVRRLSIVPNMKSQISSKCTWCEWGWWSLFHISFSLKLRPVSCCFPLNPNGTFFSGNGRNSSTLFPEKKADCHRNVNKSNMSS